jgi:hypothetical protein
MGGGVCELQARIREWEKKGTTHLIVNLFDQTSVSTSHHIAWRIPNKFIAWDLRLNLLHIRYYNPDFIEIKIQIEGYNFLWLVLQQLINMSNFRLYFFHVFYIKKQSGADRIEEVTCNEPLALRYRNAWKWRSSKISHRTLQMLNTLLYSLLCQG